MPTLHHNRFLAALCLASLSALAIIVGAQELESGVTVAAAPVRLYPDPNRTPLATLSPGTRVQILERQGDWLRISFRDRGVGDRVGFVRAEHVRTARQIPPPPPAPQEQAQPTVGAQSTATAKSTPNDAVPAIAPPPELHGTAPATAATTPSSTTPTNIRTTSGPAPLRQFPDAQLTVPDGEKTTQLDVTIGYAADTFQLLDKNNRKPLKEFPYKSFTGAEYSYSKSPRRKSGVFISPFLFLSSGKKHWLLVKTAGDYAMLRLDKNNYKLIIAEWEMRTGLKVEAEGENK
jgi:hypothetical protein